MSSKISVKCPACGYEWGTKSKLIFVMCPSCRKPVKVSLPQTETKEAVTATATAEPQTSPEAEKP